MIKSFTLIAVLIPLAGVYGCSAGPGELKGGLKSRTTEDQGLDTTKVTKDPVAKSSDAGPMVKQSPPVTVSLPSTVVDPVPPPVPSPSNEDPVVPPTIVTGAFLSCGISSMDKGKGEVVSVCQARDTKTDKVIDLAATYDKISWSALVPSSVEVLEVRDLLARKNFWHASFRLKANVDNFKAVSPQIIYKLDAVRISDGALLKLEQKITNTDRPNFYLKNLFMHGNEAPRCLDFSFDQAADHKGTTGACLGNQGQRMNFNADGTIGLHFPDDFQCMTYDPGTVNNYVEPRGCTEGGLPRPIIQWEITGQELRWRGSTLCLSRAGPQTDPSNDYIGMQACNGSADQRWEIVPF
jgi:hypothetical protein